MNRSLKRIALGLGLAGGCTADQEGGTPPGSITSSSPSTTSSVSTSGTTDPTTGGSTTDDPTSTSSATTDDSTSTSDDSTTSSTTDDAGSGTGGTSGTINLDGNGCALGIEGLLVDGVAMDVSFRQGSFMEVYSSSPNCDPSSPPEYLDDLQGGRDAATAVANALNGAMPPVACIVEQGNPSENFQFVIPTACMGTQPMGVYTRRSAMMWARDDGLGEASFGSSENYYFATF